MSVNKPVKFTSNQLIVVARVTRVVEASGFALAEVGEETIRFNLSQGLDFKAKGDEHFFVPSRRKIKLRVDEDIVCIIGKTRHEQGNYRMPSAWTSKVRWYNPDVAVNAKKLPTPKQQPSHGTPDRQQAQVKTTHQPPRKHDLQGTGLEELVFPESLKPHVAPEVIFSKDDPRRFRVFQNTKTARPPRRAIRQQIAIGGLDHLRNKAADFITADIEVETGLRNSGNFVLCENNPFLFFVPAAAA